MRGVLLLLVGFLIDTAHAAEPILPLPETQPPATPASRLGRRLFHDPRLSGSGRLSCAHCHRLDRGGDDDRPLPPIPTGPHPHNTPTVFNARYNHYLHWYGDLDTLEDQARVALQRDMQVNWPTVLARLAADPDYASAFHRLYDGVSEAAVIAALVAFERTLVTPDAPFDRFLRGDTEALTPRQRRGYVLFKRLGCSACHQGVNVGGNLRQKLGVFGRYPGDDPGRFAVTGRPEDRGVFRVPSLRNVALTAPYFHDGRVKTLEKAVALMAELQLGIRLRQAEIQDLVAFLHSLTGRWNAEETSR